MGLAEIDASFLRLTMASETSLLDWYCKPETNVAWISIAASAFGAYTPCATETLVVSLISSFCVIFLFKFGCVLGFSLLYFASLISCGSSLVKLCLFYLWSDVS